jgi:hypothetical protein
MLFLVIFFVAMEKADKVELCLKKLNVYFPLVAWHTSFKTCGLYYKNFHDRKLCFSL